MLCNTIAKVGTKQFFEIRFEHFVDRDFQLYNQKLLEMVYVATAWVVVRVSVVHWILSLRGKM